MKKSGLATIATVATIATISCLSGISVAAMPVSPEAAKQMVKSMMASDPVTADLIGGPDGISLAIKQMDIKAIDLNGDKQPEFIASLNGGVCGTLANCPTSVFRKTGTTYTPLLYTLARDLVPQKTKHQGFVDFRADAGNTAKDGVYTIYHYNGQKYRTQKCVLVTYGQTKDIEKQFKCSD